MLLTGVDIVLQQLCQFALKKQKYMYFCSLAVM